MTTSTQLERIRYWQGQLLASGDLNTQMAVVAELRRQHNRTVHSAYGIAIGLAAGDIANGSVPISCGLAYDCFGRELLIPVHRTVALPASVTAPKLLIIAYDASRGEAALSWRPQGQPVSSEGVAIARILPGPPDPMLDPAFRPVIARPLARPKIASGQTVSGDTAWESWDENGVSVGVQCVVDTSGAGFTTTPNYFAEAVVDDPPADFVPAWFPSIFNPAPDSFTLRLFMHGITREAFDIVSPLTQVAKTPAVGGKVTVASGNVFAQFDWLSRLLPVVSRASTVTALSANSATLDNPLNSFNAAERVAFGNPPRIASVTKVPAAASGLEVVVDSPANFQVGDVVARLGSTGAHPTTVASIDDQGTLELADSITLAAGDQLGIAGTPSLVTAVTATTATVQNPQLFNLNDIVVCVDADIVTTQITAISGASNEILTLNPPVSGLNGLRIASLQAGGVVQDAESEAGEVKIQVDQPKLFHAGDLVVKIISPGAFSQPVSVQSVQTSSKTLTLSANIAGLNLQDSIGAADFRVRATVLAASGVTVTVANAAVFPINSTVVRLDDSYKPAGSASVVSVSGKIVTLSAAIAGLQTGDILALASFPVSVTVESIDSEGTVTVDQPGLIKTGDVVACLPVHSGVAIVSAASGSSLQLTAPIAGLAAGDTLSVISVSGTVSITPGASNTKVTLEAGHRVRFGDFLSDIDGWREASLIRSIAFVSAVSGTDLTLSAQLDGLMTGDDLGFASLVSGSSLLELRIKNVPDVTPGEEALLISLDRIRGVTVSLFATVELVSGAANLVFLSPGAGSGTFTIRPEDLTASILLVRGSPLALVQKQNLYVSWLACQNPDPMPRPCPDSSAPDCPCGKATKS